MQNKYHQLNAQTEIDMLSDQLSPEEMYIIGFLKGFDRNTLRQWQEQGILDFSVNVI